MRRSHYTLLGAVGAGIALGGWLELFRRSRESRCVVLCENAPAPRAELFRRLCDVEAEPATIPGVSSVTVLERDTCSVRYRVEGRALGIPWWAIFRKEWEEAPRAFTWESEDGSFGLHQVGQGELEATADGTIVTLVACTHFDTPLLGPLATLTSGPFYLHPAFRAWLRASCG